MKYEVTVGLETHVELATKSKMFCGCSTAFGAVPNSQCCPVCLGLPGGLPVINETAVEFALKVGMALNCEINRLNHFDRKNYHYPDLPKGYQTSQLYLPICHDGHLDIGERQIGIHELHLEEDAGKLIHDDTGVSLIDLNRSGVPLIEIVTEPDFHSAEEVVEYLVRLRRILRCLKVSDCKMQEGSLRVDVNLSVRPEGQTSLGTRTEMKNLGSFKAVRQAIEYESKRQMEALERGETIRMETRRWDEDKGISIAMRKKESAADYRYFPDPDLVPLYLDEGYLSSIRSALPELPEEKRVRYCKEYGLPEYDAKLLSSGVGVSTLFEEAAALCGEYREVGKYILGDLLRLLPDWEDAVTAPMDAQKLADIVMMQKQGHINRAVAKEVLVAAYEQGIDPKAYVQEHGLAMITDPERIGEAVAAVLQEEEKILKDYRSGKEKALTALMGCCMRKLKGKADPALVTKILKDTLK